MHNFFVSLFWVSLVILYFIFNSPIQVAAIHLVSNMTIQLWIMMFFFFSNDYTMNDYFLGFMLGCAFILIDYSISKIFIINKRLLVDKPLRLHFLDIILNIVTLFIISMVIYLSRIRGSDLIDFTTKEYIFMVGCIAINSLVILERIALFRHN